VVTPALEFLKVSKSFGGVRALNNVDFQVLPGEVHALMGENGSGKSTIIKILAGYHSPDRGGAVHLWGRNVALPIRHPSEHGLAIVHQDLGLLDTLSVWENIGIGLRYDTKVGLPVRRSTQREKCRRLIARFGQSFDVDAPVETLSRAERSVVAILRAVRMVESFETNHRIVVLDEPTAALAGNEVKRLLDFIKEISAQGIAVIFVSHHMQEVLTVSDRMTILRSGRVLGTFDASGMTNDALLRMMLGFNPGDVVPADLGPNQDHSRQQAAIAVQDLRGLTLRGLTFDAYPGEVVGITGLAGMGQDEIPYLLAGVYARRQGQVMVSGQPLGLGLATALRAGMVLVPGDRSRDGVWLMGTAMENLTLPVIGDMKKRKGFGLSRAVEQGRAGLLMSRFGINPKISALRLSAFSGGNQQKLLMAKWLQLDPRVLVLHGPTQGVDAAGRHEVLRMIKDAADSGAVAIIASDDAEELAEVCTSVLVLRHGVHVRTLVRPTISQERILEACQVAAA
jgi:ribose transport system ATP-binding protein